MARAQITGIGSVAGAPLAALAGITDLEIIQTAAGAALVTVTRGGGQIAAYSLTGSAAQLIDTWSLSLDLLAAEKPDIEPISAGWGNYLLVPGLASTSLYAVTTTGLMDASYLGSKRAITVNGAEATDLADLVMFSGSAYGVATLRSGGIALVNASVSQTISLSQIALPAALATARPTALETRAFGATQVTVAAFGGQNALSVLMTGANGTVEKVNSYFGSTVSGWFSAPSDLAIAEVAGQRYVVMSASTSGSLTVFALGADGSLTVTDHVLDNLTTAFAKATIVELVETDGRSFVIAAGTDAGFSVLELLPGGRLQLVDNCVSSAAMPISGVTDIEAIASGTDIRLWLSQQSAPYLSEFRIDLLNTGSQLIAAAGGATLTGGDGSDTLIGQAGDDLLIGGKGEDLLLDGAGNDTLTGGAGADTYILTPDGKTDVITDFNAAEDRLDLTSYGQVALATQMHAYLRSWGIEVYIGTESLELHAAAGSALTTASLASVLTGLDRIVSMGGITLDTVTATYGSLGNDTITGTAAADNIFGLDGDDLIWGLGGMDTIWAGPGNDAVDGGDGRDLIYGDAGNDSLLGGSDFDTIYGGEGNDTIDGGSHADLLYGGDGNDRLIGGDGYDVIYGDDGNDTLLGGDVADRLYGGDGNDVLRGGSNVGTTVDGLWGGPGNDSLYGEGGYDYLSGDDGDDFLDGGDQADNLYGGNGSDTLLGGNGLDRLFGGPGDDFLDGGAGDDGLFGEDGNDTIHGDEGNDNIFGGGGDDLILGGPGNDTINGQGGFDTIDGGPGDDEIWGRFNADVFVFADGHGNDTIGDFEGENLFEKIDLSGVSTLSNIDDLRAATTVHGHDLIIDTGDGGSITLLDVDLSMLYAEHFLF